ATSLALALAAFSAWAVFRILHYKGHHALVWRVPLDLYIYAAAGTDVASGGQLYDAAYVGKLPCTYPPFAGTVFMALDYLIETHPSIFRAGLVISTPVVGCRDLRLNLCDHGWDRIFHHPRCQILLGARHL